MFVKFVSYDIPYNGMEKVLDANSRFAILLLKPDCIQRKLVDTAISMVLRQTNLCIVRSSVVFFNQEQVNLFYRQCIDLDFFRGLSEHLKSGKSIAYLMYGENAIVKLDRIVGSTDPRESAPNTVRSLGENIRRNLAHSTATIEDFKRELKVCFPFNLVILNDLHN